MTAERKRSIAEALIEESDDEEFEEQGSINAAMIELSQLLFLFRFCHFCGTAVCGSTVRVTYYVGNVKVQYRCTHCQQYRVWYGQTVSPSGYPTIALRSVAAACTSAISFYVSAHVISFT